MDTRVKQDIEKTVLDKLGVVEDNLYRASLAAQCVAIEHQWGKSGRTLKEIIAGYQAEKDRWVRALKALKKI